VFISPPPPPSPSRFATKEQTMAVRAAIYRKKSNPLKGKEIDYKNKKLLEGFVTERGKIVPSRISGVSQKDQRKLATAIKRARHLGIIPFVRNNIG